MSAHAGFLLLLLLLWLVPAYLVYVHANNRGRDAGLWAAVVLVGGLLGILLYFILAGPSGRQPTTYNQPQGGPQTSTAGGQQAGTNWNTTQPQGRQQPAGHADDTNSHVVCQQCGATNDHLANYCSNCGASLQT